ncbi:MAG: phosphate/phosphite/phosphonate ABC transporter substrate-binding protein [Hyphomicrobiales bacterium]
MTSTTQPISSLPMYDWPEISYRYDALWSALSGYLRDHSISAPRTLSRIAGDDQFWLHPDLLIGQTCGFPYWNNLREHVSLLGTPHYDVDGCDGTAYSSAILVRADAKWADISDCSGASIAVNEAGSLSGHLAMRAALGALQHNEFQIGNVYRSGAHRQSMQMVADRRADFCAIDAVCWNMAQEVMPEVTNRLKIIGWSPQMPGLPWITALRSEEDLKKLRLTVKSFFSESTYKSVYKVLKIIGFSTTENSDYAKVGRLADGKSHALVEPLLC